MGDILDCISYINETYISFSNDSGCYFFPSSRNTIHAGTLTLSRILFYLLYLYSNHSPIEKGIAFSILVICILGAVGNGAVIWLLGFRIKRSPFSTYILNLAVADFGFLTSFSFIFVSGRFILPGSSIIIVSVFFFPFLLMYSTSQFLLTAISIDRCVAIFFPLWHRCRKPPRLPTIVCALIWFLTVLLTTVIYICKLTSPDEMLHLAYQMLVNAILCLPVMTIATVSLLIKVCFKAQQHRRGKLLTIVLLTLLFFLFFAFPFNVMFVLDIFKDLPLHVELCAFLFACLNSSINPVIYFLVGRQWKSRHREGVAMAFQKVFKEEEGCSGESSVDTQ